MPRRFALMLLLLGLPHLSPAQAPPLKSENVILVTLDGMRWQEVFGGADAKLLRRAEPAAAPYAAPPTRQELLPFLWTTVAAQGQLYGNRALGNTVNVANHKHFSYPGYQEVLTGFADPHIHTNAPINNPHASVLAVVSRTPAYQGRVAAFASWEVLRNILNAPCCDFLVNAGWQPAAGPGLSAREQQLNASLGTAARPLGHERTDTLTFGYAFEYLQRAHPRVLYLSFGDTDELAHAGRHAGYLQAAHTADACLGRLWAYLQARPQYRNKTTLLITTDHGRGRGRLWTSHGVHIPCSGQTWLALLGPDTPPTGEQQQRGQLHQNQVAQTLARLLGVPYCGEQPTGAAIQSVLASK